MTRENDELSWLDLVLYFGWQMAQEPQQWGAPSEMKAPEHSPHCEKRRKKRIESLIKLVPERDGLWLRCKHASTVIATWFTYLPNTRRQYFNPELLENVRRFDFLNHQTVKDPATVFNDFTAKYNIQPHYQVDPQGKGITLSHDSKGDFMVTLIWRPWFNFSSEKKSRPVYMCSWCGVPFHPARSDARYHNQNCRSAARRSHQHSELR